MRHTQHFTLVFVFVALSAPIDAEAAFVTVDTQDDQIKTDGACSLREAIALFRDPSTPNDCSPSDSSAIDTVLFAAGVENIPLTVAPAGDPDDNLTGDYDVAKPGNGDPCELTLDATSAAVSLAVGNVTDRVLDVVSDGCKVQTLNVWFQGNDQSTFSGDGGCVRTAGGTVFEFRDATIAGCTSGGAGGGIFAAGFSTVKIIDASVQDCKAKNGGGIAVTGGCLLDHAGLSGNRADEDGGGVRVQAGSCTIQNGSVLELNEAGAGGGAVHASNDVTLKVSNSVIQTNHADNGGGVALNLGVAIFLNGAFISANFSPGGDGGGIWSNGDVVLVDSRVTGNGEGPDPETTTDDTKKGGGISMQSGRLIVVATSEGAYGIDNNKALDSGGGVSLSSVATMCINYTAGIQCSPDSVMNDPPVPPFATVIIGQNTAPTGAGMMVNGGLLRVGAPAELTGNIATSRGGAIASSAADALGNEAIIIEGAGQTDGAVVSFSGNEAGTAGGALYSTGGGANQTIKLFGNVSFTGNKSKLGGAMTIEDCAGFECVMTHLTGNPDEIGTLAFANNDATDNGGAIYSKGYSVLLHDVAFDTNHADGKGGALCVQKSTFSIVRAHFDQNTSDALGGAIAALSDGANIADVQVAQATFTNNSALTNAGAIYSNAFFTGAFLTITGNFTTGGTYGGMLQEKDVFDLGAMAMSRSIVLDNGDDECKTEVPNDNATADCLAKEETKAACPFLGPAPSSPPPPAASILGALTVDGYHPYPSLVKTRPLMFNPGADHRQNNPAIKASACGFEVDARGAVRSAGAGPCDIGAATTNRDLEVSYTSDWPVIAGQPWTLTLVVTNNSPIPLGPDDEVVLRLTIDDPSFPAPAPYDVAPWTCSSVIEISGPLVTCTRTGELGVLANENIVLDFGTLPENMTPGDRETIASGTLLFGDGESSDNIAVDSVSVEGRADTHVAITIDAPSDPVPRGGVVVYTATFSNNGPSTAAGYTVAVDLPAPLVFVSQVCEATNASCTPLLPSGDTLSATVSLAPGSSLTYIIVTYIDLAIVSSSSVTVEASTTAPVGYTDPDDAPPGDDNTAEVEVGYDHNAAQATSDVSVSVEALPPEVMPSDALSFVGVIAATGAGITQGTVSANVGNAALTIDTLDLAAGCTSGAVIPGAGPVTINCSCTGSCVLLSSSTLFTASGHVSVNAAPDIDIPASMTATPSTPDPDSDNNTVIVNAHVGSYTDFALGVLPVAAATDVPAAGADFALVYSAENNGPGVGPASVTVTLTGPVTFSAITADPAFNCATPAVGASGNVICDAISIGSGESPGFTLDVHHSAPPAGMNAMTMVDAELTTSIVDTEPSNDAASVTLSLTAAAEMAAGSGTTGTPGTTGETSMTGTSGEIGGEGSGGGMTGEDGPSGSSGDQPQQIARPGCGCRQGTSGVDIGLLIVFAAFARVRRNGRSHKLVPKDPSA